MNGLFLSPDEKRRAKGRPYRLAIVVALILFLVVAPEIQEGNSMDPVIKDGQVFVVSKISRYSAKRKAPAHDKLVILDKQYSLDAGAKDNIITRVIAVPGDTVEISKGKVIVNGEEYITGNDVKGAAGSFKKTKLKGNQVFVLSDNRSSKRFGIYDSRNPRLGDGGLIDMRKIKGNVLLRIWPLREFGIMTKQ